MFRKLISVALFLIFGLAGCNNAKLTAGDIKGTWVLTEDSRKHLPVSLRQATGQIVIHEKGDFDAVQLPGDLLWLPPGGEAKLVTGSGVWAIDYGDGAQQLRLGFRKISEEKDRPPLSETKLYFSDAHPPTLMFYFRGDPDEGFRIEFEKK
jgi:hypothetical protein